MRRIILLISVGVLCLSLPVYAVNIGGAETQGKEKFAVGLETEYVFERNLKSFSVSETIDSTYLSMKGKPELEMYREMLKISYGLFDNFDIYTKVGISDFKIKGGIDGTWIDKSTGEEGLLGGGLTVNSKTALAYGGGIKGNLELGKNWLIGADAQYLRHKKKVLGQAVVYDISDPTESETFDLNGKITTQEWHVAPYVARRLGNFTPYLGVKYSDLRMKLKYAEKGSDKFNAKDRVGVFLGTDAKIGRFRLNLEGRFVDEKAVSAGVSYRF